MELSQLQIKLRCLCGHPQLKVFDQAEYDVAVVAPGFVYCDFVYCEKCLSPIAFQLPSGVVKRDQDRYSHVLVMAEAPRPPG